MRQNIILLACLAALSSVSDAFWRLPCRGRSGVARMDPLMAPGKPSDHVHVVHGSGGFSMSATETSLKKANCTSCGVTQDQSAYWVPALYFMHENGDAELVNEVGGMLAYYFLNGENVTAFPENFRMIAGDPFLRNFPWPVPDPPKSEWSGNQSSQSALRQKALGFNCLNYDQPAEPSLGRHFLPNKTFLDEHCTDGVRFELMFPSCWNGKDVDSEDHRSHMAYPSLVMDGDCPEGFETRLVSLFYETIWDTYAFKNKQGTFVLANGDPTGYGYHGDFIYGWQTGFLQRAVDECTNLSGRVEDCPIFDLQSDSEQGQCSFSVPDELKNEDVYFHKGGLPNNVAIQYGPAYASPVKYTGSSHHTSPAVPEASVSIGVSVNVGDIHIGVTTAAPSTFSTSTSPTTTLFSTSTASSTSRTSWIPIPTTVYVEGVFTQKIVYVQQEFTILTDETGAPVQTETGGLETVSTATSTINKIVSTIVTTPTEPPVQHNGHSHHIHRRHGHGHAYRK
ncbi:WSC domain-containing protein [Aspergillus sclerotiicarbonarius CBS 121057]|uniref:WSC domain-containing protein n=1 Tax=Aspergillus sclerotiicarbonarius (strain CBS 121057 / IBT 28362) TaxID=1448318 RepID=A0A319EUQ4_ASPSB|nr:WSC domain-containing protein [Aspergillus sclerotiicarbonarius CBS 121057]